MTLLAGTALVVDSSVATIKDGLIYPKGLGRTIVKMDFSGIQNFVAVEVIDTVMAGRIALAGGEMRWWKLQRGRYEIHVTATDEAPVQSFVVSIIGANCARGLEGAQYYHCVTYAGGAVVVRNTRPPGPRTEREGNVVIVRQGW